MNERIFRVDFDSSGPAVDARVSPRGSLENLSQREVERLHDTSRGGLYELYRRCSLAVLSSGRESDDPRSIFERYADFSIAVKTEAWGVRLELENAPPAAFVDGQMIRGIQEHLFSVLRDILYIHTEVLQDGTLPFEDPREVTDAVYRIVRNAGVLEPRTRPNLAVCWGGHSISREEYEYTKKVGYELGIRGLDVCTGRGPGAMKGPMKGAAIGHSKQRLTSGRYLGITEPGIIAAEPPNAIVNRLVILPDIEKRLEAFVRLGHGVIVFPGGVGTAEEIFYLVGLRLNPANAAQPFPLIFTGPASSAEYFQQIDEFLVQSLGPAVRDTYEVVIDNPVPAAQRLKKGLDAVSEHRRRTRDAYNFNWHLTVPREFQRPFEPTHANMASLSLYRDQPAHELAAQLRRAFSGIVAGNVKEPGLRAVENFGPFELHSEPVLAEALDRLLRSFVAQRRMKIADGYRPCYRVVR